MSRRVAYLGRRDRGDRLAFVRLAGEASVETREIAAEGGAGESGEASAERVAGELRSAAAWIADRVEQTDGPRAGVRLVCVDVEGARCEWVHVEGDASGDDALAGALTAAEDGADGGGGEMMSARVSPLWAGPTLEESTVQGLAGGSVGGSGGGAGRLAVVALPDVAVRLVLDGLDERGVVVDRVVSLWQGMALAWDPAMNGGAGNARDVVRASGPSSAVVLIDPASGRLVWCWARDGALLAGGSMRAGHAGVISIGLAEVGRLTAEWLGWGAQLGVGPSRVVVVSPEFGSTGGMGLAEFGAAVGRAWPQSSVDVACHDDPVGATLLRLARVDAVELERDGMDRRRALAALSRRPGRAHKAMYRAAAVVLGLAAAGAGAIAFKSLEGARAAEREAKRIKGEMTERVQSRVTPGNAVQVSLAQDNPVALLEDVLQKERARAAPMSDVTPAFPILQELGALSAVLGNELVQVKAIDVTPLQVRVEMSVPDIETAELVKESLDTFRDTRCEWTRQISPANSEGRVGVTLMGSWKRSALGVGSGGGSKP